MSKLQENLFGRFTVKRDRRQHGLTWARDGELRVRGLAAEIIAGARAAGLTTTQFFENSQEAAAALLDQVKEGDLILVKGSRGVATDKIISALRARFELVGAGEGV